MALTSEQKIRLRLVVEYLSKPGFKSMRVSDVLTKIAQKTDEEVLKIVEDVEYNMAIDATPAPVKRVIEL